MKTIIVTAAIIYDGDKILITQRKRGSNEEFKWEFPGGKLEDEETPEHCLIREINEELNLDVTVGDIIKSVYHEYPKITILLLAYVCKVTGGELIPRECNDFKWVTLDQIDDYVFAAADIPIVEKLKSQR